SRAAILPDPRILVPAHPRDPVMTPVEQVSGGELGAGGTVDVDPRMPRQPTGSRLEVVPGSSEGDERRPPLLEPGGLRVAEVGVGDHEGVDRGRAKQILIARQRITAV